MNIIYDGHLFNAVNNTWNKKIELQSNSDMDLSIKLFEADIFFDDQATHCDRAAPHIPSGHVPHGVANPTELE